MSFERKKILLLREGKVLASLPIKIDIRLGKIRITQINLVSTRTSLKLTFLKYLICIFFFFQIF
jgi:hypothetical protein